MDLIKARNFEEELFKLQNSLKNKGLFASTVIIKEVKALKKSRVTKEPMPYTTIHKAYINTVGINYEYEKQVNNQREREDKDTDFVAQKPSGMHHISKMILQSDKNENQYYLRLSINSANKGKSIFFADGKRVDKDKLAEYLPTSELEHSKNEKQGLDKDILVISPKLQSIYRLSLGKFYYNNLKNAPVRI